MRGSKYAPIRSLKARADKSCDCGNRATPPVLKHVQPANVAVKPNMFETMVCIVFVFR